MSHGNGDPAGCDAAGEVVADGSGDVEGDAESDAACVVIVWRVPAVAAEAIRGGSRDGHDRGDGEEGTVSRQSYPGHGGRVRGKCPARWQNGAAAGELRASLPPIPAAKASPPPLVPGISCAVQFF
jgi:hypothetical protein